MNSNKYEDDSDANTINNLNNLMDSTVEHHHPHNHTSSNSDLNSKVVEVKSTQVYLAKIPLSLDQKTLYDIFEPYGTITDFKIMRDELYNSYEGYAFITYSQRTSAIKSIHELNNKLILPTCSSASQVKEAPSPKVEIKLFVGMLPKSITEEELRLVFLPYGDLREIHIIRGHDGVSKGCAFIKFYDQDAAVIAIEELNDKYLERSTKPLVVKFADSKKAIRKSSEDSEDTQSTLVFQNLYHQQLQMHLQQQQLQQQQAMYGYSSGRQVAVSPPHMPSSMQYMHDYRSQESSHSNSYMYGQQNSNYMYIPDTSENFQQSSSDFYQSSTSSLTYQGGAPVMPNYGRNYGSYDNDPDQPGSPGHTSTIEGPVGANLFIYHLPRDLTDADLATLFSSFGQVLSAKVYVDKKTSDSKGFGFVSYSTSEAAEAAIQAMNGFQIGSKRLKVQHKRNTYSDFYIGPYVTSSGYRG